MRTTIRQALDLIGRENRGRGVLLVVVSLVASGFEIVGAVLVYVLLSLVADPGSEIELPLVGDVRAQFAGVDEQTLLLGTAAIMAVFFVLRAGVHFGKVYAQSRIAYNFGARLSARLARGYLAMPYAFHLGRNSAQLIRNAHHSVDSLVRHVFFPMIRITAETVMVGAMLVVLFLLAPVATAIAVVTIGGAAALLLRVIQPRLKRLGRHAHRLDEETLRTLQQSLHGIRDIKVLGREKSFADEYRRGKRGIARALYLKEAASALPRDVMETALMGFILAFFAVGVLTGRTAEGTLSVLGLFAYAGLRLQPSVQQIIGGLNSMRFATIPMADISADIERIEGHALSQGADGPALPFLDEWRAEGVDLRYESTDTPALRDVDLRILPGEVIGIVGPTGGGKTTLVDVLTGLLEPTAGRVTVDGVDLRDHARRWYRNLGIVPQMVFLTDESLRRNIALGVPDDEVDDDAVREAVALAQLDGFVRSLPAGLDTVVGERGVRVSGGQRQRVAIARALYRRPSVLVFDEGTSALDNTTERELMSALEQLRGDHTILLVAHRLSTVRKCDRVVFVEEGRIAGLGSFDDLAATNSAFRRLAAST